MPTTQTAITKGILLCPGASFLLCWRHL